MKPKAYILPIIVLCQFACTSVWFAGNSVVDELAIRGGFGPEIIGYIISSVQLGFIIGTLAFALLMIADRFSPSRVFMICAFLAALSNLSVLWVTHSKLLLLFARFSTGFFLAGIYPVGMKIAADYYDKGLGKALGYLVGALVLGTAFPFLLKGLGISQNYEAVIKVVSLMAVLGGLILWFFITDGPFRRPGKKLQLRAGPALFKIAGFRRAAIGYFGHMWELYAFWTFIAFAFQFYSRKTNFDFSVPFWVFIIIALGGLSCIFGGYFSLIRGSLKVSRTALLISGICCLCSPLFFMLPPIGFFVCFSIWGLAVTADSPQFSSLVAQAVPAELKGTALTLVNSLGFAISILSIELLSVLTQRLETPYLFVILAIGPFIGLTQLFEKKFR